jgi:hypothetical protein
LASLLCLPFFFQSSRSVWEKIESQN